MQRPKRNSISFGPSTPTRRKSFLDTLKGLAPFSESSADEAPSSSSSNYKINCVSMQTSRQSPLDRCNHTATVVGDDMVVFGGRDMETETYFGDLFVLNLLTYEWSKPELKGDIPQPRVMHTSTLTEDGKSIIIMGGSNDTDQFGDIYILDCETWTFKLVSQSSEFPGGGLTGHTAILYEKKLYVFGGRLLASKKASSDIHTFDLETKIWNKLDVSGFIIPRAVHTSTLVHNRLRGDYILVFGGKNGDSSVDAKVVLFDFANQSWNLLEATGKAPGAPRLFHSSVFQAPFLVIFGGKREYSDDGLDTFYVFDTESNEWSRMKLASTLSVNGRFGQSMVLHGDKMIIFGGCHNKVCYNDVHELTISR